MAGNSQKKSSLEEIRNRFDADVERFSNLETGQTSTIDAPLAMELITQAAVAVTQPIGRILDLGCGAGNNTIRLLRECPDSPDCDLCDLSQPMLDRARERVSRETSGEIQCWQGDLAGQDFPSEAYDVVLAAAVLHHLRGEEEWRAVFKKIYCCLRPGGSFWITDLVWHESEAVQRLMWDRYAAYLEGVGGGEYCRGIFANIEREDSPRSVVFQLDLLRQVGFDRVDLLHKNSCFAAFGGIKAH